MAYRIASAERWGLGQSPSIIGTWGFRRRSKLEQAGAKHLIDKPAELLQYLG